MPNGRSLRGEGKKGRTIRRMEKLTVPQGDFQLSRYPEDKDDPLRAWDAADEYLLNTLAEQFDAERTLNILIINDGFGALTVALANHSVTVWTDSYLSAEGIKLNLSRNKQPAENVNIMNSLQTPDEPYDVVLIKIPKTLAMLEDQLTRIRPILKAETQIMGAAMVKALHTSTLSLFEKYIGMTRTSLARKKARLIHCQLDKTSASVTSRYPTSYILEGTDHTLINHANVFSRESLDIGTRFFLQHLPKDEKYRSIIDLACGNGVIGLIAAEKNPQAELTFLDESYMAVASAQANFNAAFGESRQAVFQVVDGLQGIPDHSADLILNNPPFHQQHAMGDGVAWNMFRQSRNVLTQNGELWVVANRHLGYHVKLKKLFGNCESVAGNKKFVVLKAVKITKPGV